MTHVAYPGCYCADCVEGTPAAFSFSLRSTSGAGYALSRQAFACHRANAYKDRHDKPGCQPLDHIMKRNPS